MKNRQLSIHFILIVLLGLFAITAQFSQPCTVAPPTTPAPTATPYNDSMVSFGVGGITAPGSDGLMKLEGNIDTNNSTATTLGSGEIFTGTATDILSYGIVFINVASDVASAADGLSLQQSSDGTNWDHCDDYTITAGESKNYSINPHSRYFRVVYTNGVSDQAVFRLQTVLKGNAKPSSHRVKDVIVGNDDATLSIAAIQGENGDGNWHKVQVTTDGNLAISDNSSGLAIAEGVVTGKTFIHKFGQAPDFDTTDGFVTIWDGANDAGINQMDYVFSTSADINNLSSSDVDDSEPIEVQGLDADYNLSTQTITLSGQSRITLTTSLIRVFRMKNVGSTNLEGNVYIYTQGATISSGVPSSGPTVRAVIQQGNNQTLMAIYTVPAGKTAYMRDWYIGQANTLGAATNAASTVKLFARPFGQVFQLKHINTIKADGTGAYQHIYQEPEVFTEKTDIFLEADTSIDASGVSGGFDIVLVDN